MKYILLLLTFVSVSSCVTISVPLTQTPAVGTPTAGVQAIKTDCDRYVAPTRQQVPVDPVINEIGDDYVKYLENLAETLAGYAVELRDYIVDEHRREDRALEKYRLNCQSLSKTLQ